MSKMLFLKQKTFQLSEKQAFDLSLEFGINTMRVASNLNPDKQIQSQIQEKFVKLISSTQSGESVPSELLADISQLIQKFSSLQIIISSFCNIRWFGAQYISNFLGYFQNNVQRLELIIGKSNKLEEEGARLLGQGIEKLGQTLTELSLSISKNNNIGEIGASELFKSLRSLKLLEKLEIKIGQNNIRKGLAELADSFQEIGQLKQLKLQIGSKNSITYEGFSNLCAGMVNLKNLTSLFLGIKKQNGIRCDIYQPLGVTLKEIPDLKQLCLSLEDGNGILSEGRELQGLYSSLVNLTEFKFTIYESTTSSENIISLFHGFQKCSNLRVFHLEMLNNNIKQQAAETIANAFEQMTELEEVSISIEQISIYDTGYKLIMASLGKCQKMRELILKLGAFNNFSDLAITELGASLKNYHQLTLFQIQIANFQVISEQSISSLFEGIVSCEKLNKLALQFTTVEFSNKIAEKIKEGFGNLTNLNELVLQLRSYKHKHLSQVEFKQISDGIALLNNLKSLDLDLQVVRNLEESEEVKSEDNSEQTLFGENWQNLTMLESIKLHVVFMHQKFSLHHFELFSNLKYLTKLTALDINLICEQISIKILQDLTESFDSLLELQKVVIEMDFSTIVENGKSEEGGLEGDHIAIDLSGYLNKLKRLQEFKFKLFSNLNFPVFFGLEDLQSLEKIDIFLNQCYFSSAQFFSISSEKSRGDEENIQTEESEMIPYKSTNHAEVKHFNLHNEIQNVQDLNLFNLSNLKELVITFSNIYKVSHFPFDLCLQKMRTLERLSIKFSDVQNLNQQSFVKLGQSLSSLPQLKHLSLLLSADRQLTDNCYISICQGLRKLSNLSELHLNMLAHLSDYIYEELSYGLRQLTNLNVLHLQFGSIFDTFNNYVFVQNALKTLKHLYHLEIKCGNQMLDYVFFPLFKHLPLLLDNKFILNTMNTIHYEKYSDAKELCPNKLKKIKMVIKLIDSKVKNEYFNTILDCLQEQQYLTEIHLDFKQNQLSLPSLISAIKQCSQLQKLDIIGCLQSISQQFDLNSTNISEMTETEILDSIYHQNPFVKELCEFIFTLKELHSFNFSIPILSFLFLRLAKYKKELKILKNLKLHGILRILYNEQHPKKEEEDIEDPEKISTFEDKNDSNDSNLFIELDIPKSEYTKGQTCIRLDLGLLPFLDVKKLEIEFFNKSQVGFGRNCSGYFTRFKMLEKLSLIINHSCMLTDSSLFDTTYGDLNLKEFKLTIKGDLSMSAQLSKEHIWIQNMVNLNTLALNIHKGNIVNVNSIKCLYEQIRNLKQLNKIDLNIESNYSLIFIGVISDLPNLKDICIRQYNKIKFQKNQQNVVEELEFDFSIDLSSDQQEGISGLNEGLMQFSTLRSLLIEFNGSDENIYFGGKPEEARRTTELCLSKCFEKMQSLESLTFRVSQIEEIYGYNNFCRGVSKLTNLQQFTLQIELINEFSFLSELISELSMLVNLKIINIIASNLDLFTVEMSQQLYKCIQNQKNLKMLQFTKNYNYIKQTYNNTIHQNNEIQICDCHGDGVESSTSAENISKLKELILDAEDNCIHLLSELSLVLPSLTQLETLKLTVNNIISLSNLTNPVFDSFSSLSNLRTLSLTFMKIYEIQIIDPTSLMFIKYLTNLTDLTLLFFGGSGIKSEHLEMLGKGLKDLSHLQSFTIFACETLNLSLTDVDYILGGTAHLKLLKYLQIDIQVQIEGDQKVQNDLKNLENLCVLNIIIDNDVNRALYDSLFNINNLYVIGIDRFVYYFDRKKYQQLKKSKRMVQINLGKTLF